MHFPGSGITPFNVGELTFMWWRIYRARAKEYVDAVKKQQNEQARRQRR